MEDSQPSRSRRRRDLDNAGNYTATIPFDLIVEIFSHLPAKSLIRFQSVSKQWFSFIRSKNFVDLFLTRSKTRPRLLLPLTNLKSGKRFILSAIEDDKSSSTVIPRLEMTFSDSFYYMICRPVNGLICCIGHSLIAVCNPTTRQIVKLPDVPPNGIHMHARLGYDPVEDQYKVLCVLMTRVCPFGRRDKQEHFVCTVRSSQEQVWRKIENTSVDNYRTITGEICIDGALYYGVGQSRIVRFDVRSEKIEFIKAPEDADFSRSFPCTLLNYNGKLGGVDYHRYKRVMRLWILEDAEKQEWSSMTRAFPSELESLYVMSKGEIHTGELMVFHPGIASYKPTFVCYYDFKNESIIKQVEIMVDGDLRRIHGIGELTACRMLCYPGYFENIKFLSEDCFYYYTMVR